MPLAKITFEGLSEWAAGLSGVGLGPSGVRQSVFVISAALDSAVRTGRIRTNAASGLGLPRPQQRDYVFLTHDQIHALADAAEAGHTLILLLGYTGLRWGEATALRARDIDLTRRRIDVRRAFSDVGGQLVLGTPKSHESRTVPVPRFLAAELAELLAGSRPDELALTTDRGYPLRLSNWRRKVFALGRAGADVSSQFRIHDLRHTAASLMRRDTRRRCSRRSWATPASRRRWTCMAIYAPATWTAMRTGLTRPRRASSPARIRPDELPDDADEDEAES